ncbi:MAG: NAD(P)-dependent oxidoreductase [Gemmatimonadales bacterium]
MRVGFIGLGAIGTPIARHLAEAYELVVWNRTIQKAHEFAQRHGVVVAESPGDLVSQVEHVVTCLPTSQEVSTIAGNATWKAGQLLVDCTSGDPMVSREIAESLRKNDCGFVDAPVSGGTDGARRGDMTVMLGGNDPWLSIAQELVSPFAGKVRVVGGVGAGHALKAVNNALLAINIQAAGEGLAALKKLGVAPSVALEVINSSSGRSNVTENLIPARVLTRKWPRTFRLALLDKDVGIALDTVRGMGIPDSAMSVAKACMQDARAELGEEADHVEAIRVIERLGGVVIED